RPAPRSRAPRRHPLPARATPCGLSFRWASTAASPTLYTLPVPCNPATVPANTPATLQPLLRSPIPPVDDSQTGPSRALAGLASGRFPLFLLPTLPLPAARSPSAAELHNFQAFQHRASSPELHSQTPVLLPISLPDRLLFLHSLFPPVWRALRLPGCHS